MADTLSSPSVPHLERIPQAPSSPERAHEYAIETAVVQPSDELHIEPIPVAASVSSGAQAVPIVTTMHRQIERVLEEDLVPLYRELDATQRVQFRTMGERTAAKIEVILTGAVVKVRDIINAIMEWLSLLPGVNRFFVEQEAKLKADKILFLKELA